LKIAAKPLRMELTVYRKSPAPYPMVPSPTHYDLSFSHNTARLAYQCIVRYDPSRSSNVNDLYVTCKQYASATFY